MSNHVRADQILRALERRHRAMNDLFFTEVKTGPTYAPGRPDPRRLDAVAVKPSWTKPCISGYEVKVSRSDFTGDEKWQEYLPYCHRFYFACPAGLISPDDLPREIGLVWYSPEVGALKVKRQAVYRPIGMTADLLYYLVIWRSDPERHPFFSSDRERIEAWLADRQERLALAKRFRSALLEEAQATGELRRQNEALKEKLQRAEERLQDINAALLRFGIHAWDGWTLERELRQLVERGVANDTEILVRRLQETVQQLAERLRGEASA